MYEVYSATIGLMERITWHCAPPLAKVPQTTISSCEMNSLINHLDYNQETIQGDARQPHDYISW